MEIGDPAIPTTPYPKICGSRPAAPRIDTYVSCLCFCFALVLHVVHCMEFGQLSFVLHIQTLGGFV